jgi:hypothetical protein
VHSTVSQQIAPNPRFSKKKFFSKQNFANILSFFLLPTAAALGVLLDLADLSSCLVRQNTLQPRRLSIEHFLSHSNVELTFVLESLSTNIAI